MKHWAYYINPILNFFGIKLVYCNICKWWVKDWCEC